MELALPECEAPLRHAHRACMASLAMITETSNRATGTSGDTVGCFHLWAPQRISGWSGDRVSNVGPRQFEQWVLPEMQALSRMLEYSFYHLDGFNAVLRLSRMLEIPELTGMQFTMVAGHTRGWALPVYRQIRRGSKVPWID